MFKDTDSFSMLNREVGGYGKKDQFGKQKNDDFDSMLNKGMWQRFVVHWSVLTQGMMLKLVNVQNQRLVLDCIFGGTC